MILFIGEISINGLAISSAPPDESIKNGVWSTISSDFSEIHICDFSSQKNNFLEMGPLSIAVSGLPVIQQAGVEKSKQISYIANALTSENHKALSNANGVFCGFILNRGTNVVHLFTDYLGLRQIYIYRTNERFVFSNAKWLITSYINRNNLSLDLDSITEIGVLGYPLANRTQFKEIQLLPPGCVMKITSLGMVQVEQYYDLTSIQRTPIGEEEALEKLYLIWKIAVQERCSDTKKCFGFLSGGMDSRLLVHTLKTLDIDVFTANFAPLGTLDRVFGEMSAKSMQVHHFQHPSGTMLSDVLTETVEAWKADDQCNNFFNDTPFVWSGDGGSVGMGHVYLTDEMSYLASQSEFEECARIWCCENNRNIPLRLFRDGKIKDKLELRISDLMQDYGHTNPERAVYYYLMLNDQRRHLDKHYEIFHRRGFDLQLPFFDKRLIEFISSLPTEMFNYHRIYDKLFRKISGSLTSTPWQTYPKHIPCLLKVPDDLTYQWSDLFYSKREKRIKAKEDAIYCLEKSIWGKLPRGVFDRTYLFFGAIATIGNISDYSYCRHYIEPCFE